VLRPGPCDDDEEDLLSTVGIDKDPARITITIAIPSTTKPVLFFNELSLSNENLQRSIKYIMKFVFNLRLSIILV
jgi:hypothetical protein